MVNNKSIDILSIDAKDIYISNNYIENNSHGYNIKFQDGRLNTKKFINTFDYSLDLIKLKEVYEKVYRNTLFTFQQNNHEYTTKVINVTFKYSVKEFNKINKDTYVKLGYNINNLIFNDGVCIINNQLIGIEINKKIIKPISSDILGKYFYIDDGKYHVKSNIKTIKTIEELRKDLYDKGFICDGLKYIRFKRSSGSSRVGKCLFIDKNLYPRMHKWEMCGIKIKKGQETDLAALEAYISLTLSSIIDTIEINPENILLIDDYQSEFFEDVIETKLTGNSLESITSKVKIKNSIWDGQSIGDVSLFEKYPNKGMLLLRNQFFKSAVFNGNIQKWFRDNNITEINQLNGITLAKNINDIKLITTPSSIKYLKFGSFDNWVTKIDSLFGIVKYDKPTHNFNGRMVQTHYQLLNTLQLSQKEMSEFLKPSLDYLKMIKHDPSVLRYYIKYPENVKLDLSPAISKNDIIYRMLGINNRFINTKLYYDFKNDLVKSYVKNMRAGHVLVNGNYSTLFGNPLEMLQQSIGQFNGKSLIGIGNIHSKNFKYNQLLLGSRSPHVTIGNIWLPYNTSNELIDKYFNLSKEIVCINSIGESVLDRLSGCDFDSDTTLLTDNKILINAAIKNYDKFKVPVNHVESIKKKRRYTQEEQADLDIKTSKNKIGDIINLSQELNTLLWHKLNNGTSYEDIEPLYCDICQLDVMSGIEIDKAKKEFIFDTHQEMKKIKERWIKRDEKNRLIKPNFFAYLARNKGYYDSKRKNYLRHDTSMDYLEKVINQFQLARKNIGNIKLNIKPFSEMLNMENYNIKNVKYNQVTRVITLIRETNNQVKKIFKENGIDDEQKYKATSELKQKCIEYIGNLQFSKSTMIYLLMAIEKKEYKDISRIIFNTLFGYPNTAFYSIIKDSIEPIEIFSENVEGNINIYDIKFSKTYKK